MVRNGRRPLIAVVQRAKDELWVLPRGKLKSNESAMAGARREVIEETGHRVRVREFVGAITYRARGRPKVVQFWRMQAEVKPSRDVMKDIMAVEWLPLSTAVRRLSYPLEKTVPEQHWPHDAAAAKTPAKTPGAQPGCQSEAPPPWRENNRPQAAITPRCIAQPP